MSTQKDVAELSSPAGTSGAIRSCLRQSVWMGLLFQSLLWLTADRLLALESEHQPTDIPRTWDQTAIDTVELPRPAAGLEVHHMSEEDYYALPVRPIYRSYPVYRPELEPPGYWEKLQQAEPEIVWDAAAGLDDRDLLVAGESAFNAPVVYDLVMTPATVRSAPWFEAVDPPVTPEGIVPGIQYVVRERGRVEVGSFSCGMCHTRVLGEGTVVPGAQGNFPLERAVAFFVRSLPPGPASTAFVRIANQGLFATPWVEDDPGKAIASMSMAELADAHAAIPPGVIGRQRSSLFSPTQVPDLIGIENRRYLDHTGLVQHRSIGDLMRYGALNQGMDFRSDYGGFVPLRDVNAPPQSHERYSDAQLYALARYVYSLEPPPNPNPFGERARRGQKVFEREGCATCHTPPDYTNNKLTLATGFEPPEDHYKRFDIMEVEVGTDPTLALETGRSTGYYKVPSLKGVWYRGPLEHNGSVASLEDWFDPERTREDYIPTGFRGYRVEHRAIEGHPFGLGLGVMERDELVAFLKTL